MQATGYHHTHKRNNAPLLLLSLERPSKETKTLIGAVIHTQGSKHKVPKSVLRAVLGRMQFTIHAARRTPHGASRLVQAMPAWLVKTRRALSRQSSDARVYDHTTTAMHKLSAPPHTENHAPVMFFCISNEEANYHPGCIR